jgi:hypothetical protein
MFFANVSVSDLHQSEKSDPDLHQKTVWIRNIDQDKGVGVSFFLFGLARPSLT